MELLYTLPALIFALIWLMWLKKELKQEEDKLKKERIKWEWEIYELECFKKEHNKYVKLVYNNFNAILILLWWEKVNKAWFHSKTIVLKIKWLQQELKELNKSNSANKGWNTRYREDIKELTETVQKLSTINNKLTKKNNGKEKSNTRDKGNR